MRRRASIATVTVLVLAVIAGAAAIATVSRVTAARFVEKRFDERLSVATHGMYRFRLGGTSYDLLRRAFVASDLSILPDSTAWEERRRARTRPGICVSFEAPTVRIRGIDLWSLARGRVWFENFVLEDPVVTVFEDRRIPGESPPRPARMPHELLRKIPCPLRVDTLVVEHGRVHYSEIANDGARPGTIRFEDVLATVYDLRTDPRADAPCRIDAQLLLAGAAHTDFTLEYDLASPRLDLEYRGRIGRMPATALNEMLVDLEGFRVKSGVLDSTWFDFHVKDDLATGSVQVLYHDLDTELVDKVTLERGTSKKLQTFINNTFRLASANPGSDLAPAIVVPVRRERVPDENLVEFLWVILRIGVTETLGV